MLTQPLNNVVPISTTIFNLVISIFSFLLYLSCVFINIGFSPIIRKSSNTKGEHYEGQITASVDVGHHDTSSPQNEPPVFEEPKEGGPDHVGFACRFW